jgi:hypothetical protein
VSSLEVSRGSIILDSIIARLLVDSRVIGLVAGLLVVGLLVAGLLVAGLPVASFCFLGNLLTLLFIPYIFL